MLTLPKTVPTARLARSNWLVWLLVALIGLGVAFRFIHLDGKIYWHDEAYTSMRAAGFTRHEIDTALFQNQFVAAPALQQFQQIKPGSTAMDTLLSLKIEDPQHPPLYFWMARGWMHLSGSSITASRLLPALLSLLSLPLMYGLAIELFRVGQHNSSASHSDTLSAEMPERMPQEMAAPSQRQISRVWQQRIALMAVALLALSPFDILFAQTARQYSLLTVTLIGSSWLLLRAIRLNHWREWALFSGVAALGFYTHPFFALTLIGQGVFVLLLWLFSKPRFSGTALRLPLSFLAAAIGALVLYSPWIWVLLNHYQRAAATTDWTRVNVGFPYLAKLWTLSFTSLFFDLDFGFDNPLTFGARLPFLLVILAAMVLIARRTSRLTSGMILTSVAVPFLLLALPDLILGGKRSAVSRYLISCYPGIQLAVAYLLCAVLARSKRLGYGLLVLVFTGSIVSCTVSAAADTWWNKDLSYFNAEVIRLVNAEANAGAAASPVLLSDMGDDYTNMGDLVSLSYGLRPSVRLYLAAQPADLTPLTPEPTVLVFRASQKLEAAVTQQGWQLEPVSQRARLWRIVKPLTPNT